jgi:hypothetical protein
LEVVRVPDKDNFGFLIEEQPEGVFRWRLDFGKDDWTSIQSPGFDSEDEAVAAIRAFQALPISRLDIHVRIEGSTRTRIVE